MQQLRARPVPGSSRAFGARTPLHPRTRCAAGADGGREGGVGAGRGGPTGLDIQGFRPTSPQGWALMQQALRGAGVKLVAPQEVVFAAQAGATLVVDVRPAELFAAGHVQGAVNVPYYRPIQGWSPWQVARRVGYAAFGVFNGTEVNPDFAAEVQAAAGGDKAAALVLYCSQGGSLEATGGQRRGFQTRSLIAAYDLLQRGFTSLSVMRGGFFEWEAAGREVVVPGQQQAAGDAGGGGSMARN